MILAIPEEPRRDDEPTASADRRPEHELLELLLQDEGEWLRRKTRHTAMLYGVDADELFQETLLGLLRSTINVDPTQRGLRTWLNQLIRWRAADLSRRERLGRGIPMRLEDLDEELNLVVAAPHAPSSADELHEVADHQQRLQEIGLTRDQATTLAMRVSGFELPLKEFAKLVGRPYAKTRQDYSRGLRRVQDWIGLTPAEARALTESRRAVSVEHAAARLGLPVEEFRAILDQAHQKIHDALSGLEGSRAEPGT